MPPIALVPPEELKAVLEEDGYSVAKETEYHWFFVKGSHDEPITLPKESGEDGCVPMEVMERTLGAAQISHYKYFDLRDKAREKMKKTWH